MSKRSREPKSDAEKTIRLKTLKGATLICSKEEARILRTYIESMDRGQKPNTLDLEYDRSIIFLERLANSISRYDLYRVLLIVDRTFPTVYRIGNSGYKSLCTDEEARMVAAYIDAIDKKIADEEVFEYIEDNLAYKMSRHQMLRLILHIDRIPKDKRSFYAEGQ